MAIFNNPQPAPRKDKDSLPSFAAGTEPVNDARDVPTADFAPLTSPPLGMRPGPATSSQPQPTGKPVAKESVIAADLTIEGKIEGTGHVRIAGRFKGDVNVQGDLTIEKGAKLSGGVRASKVNVGGELEGNIESASRVELFESGAISGDLKADTLIVAAGSRIRGHVECGWADAASGSSGKKTDDATPESDAA
ncbi:MAG: hypothetical protein DI635_06670 [Pseudoxanthomonas suwonensis]|nr:MAG: hypothetical protein DI635_06670 [Pseudoxanthomonas suwonensis]